MALCKSRDASIQMGAAYNVFTGSMRELLYIPSEFHGPWSLQKDLEVCLKYIVHVPLRLHHRLHVHRKFHRNSTKTKLLLRCTLSFLHGIPRVAKTGDMNIYKACMFIVSPFSHAGGYPSHSAFCHHFPEPLNDCSSAPYSWTGEHLSTIYSVLGLSSTLPPLF